MSLIEGTSQVKTLEFCETEIDPDLLTALVRLPLRLPQLKYINSHTSVTAALRAVRRSLTSLDLRPHELVEQDEDVGQVLALLDPTLTTGIPGLGRSGRCQPPFEVSSFWPTSSTRTREISCGTF